MIQDWEPQIDKELRRSAGSRMLSEWAKKADCWEVIQKLSPQFPNPLPPEISTPQSTPITTHDSLMPEGEKTLDENIDPDELVCIVRPLFSDGAECERDAEFTRLASQIGLENPNSHTRAEIDSVLRSAVQRGILESSGDVIQLTTRSIADYSRDHLKVQFLASLPQSDWIERDDAIRAFARWMGFRRTGSAIDETTRSLINGLLRDDRLESMRSRIRKRVPVETGTDSRTVSSAVTDAPDDAPQATLELIS